jgi:DNA-binding NarL/FixJ family response regulator
MTPCPPLIPACAPRALRTETYNDPVTVQHGAPFHIRPDAPWRIVIVKRNRLAADSLRAIAMLQRPMDEVTMCYNAGEALSALHDRGAQLIIVGLTLPDMDGQDLIAALWRAHRVERALVVSGRHDERTREFLRATPFTSYLDSAKADPNAIKEALAHVRSGRLYRTAIARDFSPDVQTTPRTRLLSPTEMQVFAILGEGYDDVAAAERLGISSNTVRTHRQRIMRKLGVQTSRHLIFEAIRRGVIRITPHGVLHPGLEAALAKRAGPRACIPAGNCSA